MIKQYKKIKTNAENSSENQMSTHLKNHEIKVNRSRAETIKRWMNNVKEFEKGIEKTLKNDMRRYFEMLNCEGKLKYCSI